MRLKSKASVIATGAVAAIALGAGVAHAEGSWTSSISAWLPGKESRHWQDNNSDSVATTISFSGCSVSNGSFSYAGLQLKKERDALPDPVVARDENHCNTSNFGDRSAGGYYFNYSNLNGSDQPRASFSVKTVNVRY
jgi:hypothetical protein